MAVTSAPGKVYLFGEHAVVYGEPAIPCAIDRRTAVRVTTRTGPDTRIEATDLPLDGFAVEYATASEGDPRIDVPEERVRTALGYVETALERARETAAEPGASFDVRIESDIPLGAGLGSSAAVTVATLDAATRALGTELGRQELADLAYRTERTVQEGNASRADTFCSTMGGAVRVEGDECSQLEAPDLPFVIGFDGGAGNTAELVAGVRELVDTYAFAGDIVRTIGDLTRAGESALQDGDRSAVGRLMDVDHGLLAALGVSAPTLDSMVWAARRAGADGAKLTGAGGGGCIVAVGKTDAVRTALEATPGCESAFAVDLDRAGIRREGSQ